MLKNPNIRIKSEFLAALLPFKTHNISFAIPGLPLKSPGSYESETVGLAPPTQPLPTEKHSSVFYLSNHNYDNLIDSE